MQVFYQKLLNFKDKFKSAQFAWPVSLTRVEAGIERSGRLRTALLREVIHTLQQLIAFRFMVREIGATAGMEDFEKRKLGIFNELNFFQLIVGLCMPVIGLCDTKSFPALTWVVAVLPIAISISVLFLNANRKYDVAVIFYFIAYPVFTSMVCMKGIHVGIELYFILYGILSVFFLQEISQMLFSVGLSMISYFMLAILWSDHRFQLEEEHILLYFFNQLTGIAFIFYGLWLIKKENLGYQASILSKNKEIAENTVLLEQQKMELTELNTLKNKLFSVIAHDLKTPMYSLRNLFRTIQTEKLPAKEIKSMIPDVINNLNYTTGLMENLLQWAKSQMQSGVVTRQTLDISAMITDTIQLQALPAKEKKQVVEKMITAPCMAVGDKNMIDLVLRNLLSNAIKFTPAGGRIIFGITALAGGLEIYVKDSGIGIGGEALQRIDAADYYTTNGTSHEPGTGLGLMLCKEFLSKNNSRLKISSVPGKGSTFSFILEIACTSN